MVAQSRAQLLQLYRHVNGGADLEIALMLAALNGTLRIGFA